MIDKNLLEKLYTSYGFEIVEKKLTVYCFLYTKSRYFGVDIILLDDTKETSQVAEVEKSKFSQLGYAVNIKTIKSNYDAEIELFKSFFSFDSSIQKFKRKYKTFVDKQKKSILGFDYNYIESPFDLDNHLTNEKGIFDIVNLKLSSSGAELVIIEAAAGYGKTCTAYELLNIITSNPKNQTPIFTELSRNRGVRKFRYILLDEIDLEYPSLNSELVNKEIRNGRIPIIIDGFDELLDKVNIDSPIDNTFDEVETMLDTIGNLLEFKAKIILTTRKTAIFTGEEFEKWILKWNNKFNVSRISLKEPRVKDWLGEEKYQCIKDKNIPIQYLANPVILSFLKNLEYNSFLDLTEKPSFLVDSYFDKMLSREIERQNLIMTVATQLDVFTNVVRMLIEFDCTYEDKDFFKDIIFDSNRNLIEQTLSLYGGDDKHTVESLVDSLATHALLDRKGRYENQIGFINDFVLGTFIGKIIENEEIERLNQQYSPFMIEVAVTAYRVQGIEKKQSLWNKITECKINFKTEVLFGFDIYLIGKISRNYKDIAIYEMAFYSINFIEKSIESSVFLNCTFKNCVFQVNALKGVSFINCVFEDCNIIDAKYIDGKNDITVIKCEQKECSIFIQSKNNFGVEDESIFDDFEKDILRKLLSISVQKGHHITKLTSYFEKEKKKSIYKALAKFQDIGIIDIRGIHVNFVINYIPTIKYILDIKDDL